VVSVTVAAVDRLHVLAHRAAASARNVEDWWGSPLDTALAAVALARHAHVYRDDAERTLERLLRWWHDEEPRRISADVAALALAARAAVELQRGEPALTAEAAAAVADLAARDRAMVPELHLALCVWALDGLVADRDQQPWPALCGRATRPRLGGVEEPLRRYVDAVSASSFEANRLVQELIGTIGSAPGVSESSLLLWLISVAAERLARVLPADDNALQVLVRRRAELAERLAGEIDEETFVEPTIADFGAEDAEDLRVIRFLSRFEALLLDIALAPSDGAAPWLTYGEASTLFDARERAAREEAAVVRRHLLDRVGGLTALLALVSGLALWLGLRELDTKPAVGYSVAIALAAGVLVGAVAALRSVRPSALVDSLGIFFALLGLLALVNAGNQHLKKPLLADPGGLIVGAVVAAVAAVIWQFVAHVGDRDARAP
jgi:hypothetical protein